MNYKKRYAPGILHITLLKIPEESLDDYENKANIEEAYRRAIRAGKRQILFRTPLRLEQYDFRRRFHKKV